MSDEKRERPDAGVGFGSLDRYERATEEIWRRDYGDLVQLRAGQREFLTFRLGSELHAIPLEGVLEVTRPPAITPVPFVPSWVPGVMLLRGSVVPVFDVGRLLGLETRGNTVVPGPAERILLVRRRENAVGLLVGEVLEVVAVPDEDVGPVPATVEGKGAEFVLGVARKGQSLYAILDHGRLASCDLTPDGPGGVT